MGWDPEQIEEYCRSISDEIPQILTELDEYTHQHHHGATMISGAFQGRLLAMISRMLRPKIVLEVGTYTGYSALCFAEGLAEGGLVHSIDIDERLSDTHDKFIGQSIYKDQIKVHFGDAKQIIPTMEETLDLVFIDGAKKDYAAIFDMCLPKLRPGGVILADNVLWKGKVLGEKYDDATTLSIKAFNQKIHDNKEVNKLLLPIRDGLFWITKNKI